MPHLELKLQHYIAIRDFMSNMDLEPEDAMTSSEEEALGIVKQIIANIEEHRAKPRVEKPKHRRGRAA